jgi:hypothetical protein
MENEQERFEITRSKLTELNKMLDTRMDNWQNWEQEKLVRMLVEIEHIVMRLCTLYPYENTPIFPAKDAERGRT